LARVDKVERESLPPEERRFFDAVLAIRRRPISGPFIVLMNSSPDLAARFAQLGHYFHARGQADESIVPIRDRSFISLIGSRVLESPYEWAAWVNWALDAGVAQATVDAIREGRPLDLDPTEKLVNDVCGQLVSNNHRVNDATFNAALKHYGVRGVVDLVVTLGYFAMIALPLNAFEMQMSAAQLGQRKPFKPLDVRGTPWSEARSEQRSLPRLTDGRSATRVTLIDRHEDLPAADQHFLDRIIRSRGWVSPAFGVLLHTPDVAERIAHIGEYILYQSRLTAQARALASLLTARELDAGYTWSAGVSAARACGLDARLIAQVEHDEALAAATAEQRALATFCRQLLRGNHHVGDAQYAAATEHFGVPGAVQIAAVAGYVAMMSIITNAFALAPAGDATRPAL
jgi:4-carboxymuconolactone decarboxylase